MPPDRLASSRRGAGERLVLVHGFTQTARSWDLIAEQLTSDHEVLALDAPGHGESAAVTADLATSGDLVAAAGAAATYIGYSMGARICLHAALTHPALVQRLVLVSGTAGIDDDTERADRRAADDALADSIERDGVDAFLGRWLARPMFATLPPAAATIEDRRRNTAAGLAASLRLVGTGTQAPLWDRLGELAMPVLLVAGQLDPPFVGRAERMAGLIPTAELAVIPGAGHTAHLEQPDAFLARLRRFLGVSARPAPPPEG